MSARAGLLALAVLLLAPLALAPRTAAAEGCAGDRVDLRGPRGQARFTVEVVDDVAGRAKGLMFREEMARSHGMLFVYDKAEPVAFWMENTLIPLDMVFADARGVVRKVAHDARPLDRTAIPSGVPVQFVLEINGGLAARLGIEAGSEMRHPRINAPDAAWPCD